MFDTRIEILEYVEERDEYNDRSKALQPVTVCYAQRTENGGRENLYAGRIVHENEVVYSIRWQEDLTAGQMIRDDGYLRKITSIHEEGRRWRLHLKCTKSDADSQG
ncbi:MAG: phage head closure protein [Alistipes onderdonkii]